MYLYALAFPIGESHNHAYKHSRVVADIFMRRLDIIRAILAILRASGNYKQKKAIHYQAMLFPPYDLRTIFDYFLLTTIIAIDANIST